MLVNLVVAAVVDAEEKEHDGWVWFSDTYGLGLLFVNGLGYFLYNQMSFVALSKMHIISHSIGNVMRRVVTILFSIMVFRNPISALNLGG